MKLYIVLTLFVALASASAGVVPSPENLLDQLPTVALVPPVPLEGRITNGELAEVGQFPYQAGLSLNLGGQNAWCGGTLISNRYVVTAAHCAERAESATVYLGATDIYDINEKGQQRIYCEKKYITVHEKWNRWLLLNDIALIKLPTPVEFSDNVQPATLPKKSESYSTYEGETGVASGWGKESDASTTVSQLLRFIEVPIMSETACNRYYFGVVTSNMVCINTRGGKSTCSGDSGGPLVIKDGDTNYLIGATSFGIRFGCELGWPGVFTRITSYLDWIEEKTGIVNL